MKRERERVKKRMDLGLGLSCHMNSTSNNISLMNQCSLVAYRAATGQGKFQHEMHWLVRLRVRMCQDLKGDGMSQPLNKSWRVKRSAAGSHLYCD